MGRPISVPEGRQTRALDQHDLDWASQGGPRHIAARLFAELMLADESFESVDAEPFLRVAEAMGQLPDDEYENGVSPRDDLAATAVALARVFAGYADWRVVPPESEENNG